jgi:hypothetical protein
VESRSNSPFVSAYPELHGAGTSGGIGFRSGKADGKWAMAKRN